MNALGKISQPNGKVLTIFANKSDAQEFAATHKGTNHRFIVMPIKLYATKIVYGKQKSKRNAKNKR